MVVDMIISHDTKKITYRCDSCGNEKKVNFSIKYMQKEVHVCRTCNAKAQAKLGGEATKNKYGHEHYEKLGKQLRKWHTEHPLESEEACKLNGLRALETGVLSRAGKLGGRKTADSGKLREAGKLANTPEAMAKAFQTKKRRGLLLSSKPELSFLGKLREEFPQTVHQVTVGRYSIDFYIPEIDTFVQFDGEYWHGLNMPKECLTGVPKKKYARDRACDVYCQSVGKRLIRVTDREFAELSWVDIQNRLKP